MSYEIHADHGQTFLLPPSLEDWVPLDHLARFVRDFVSALDLEALGFRRRSGGMGAPSYSSELLLTVWLYGYLEKIRSTRKLEHACRNHMPLIWLTGMHYPDHNSLWRFFRDNHGAIRGVFRQSVAVAKDVGMVGMVVHALDGTKVAVAASKKHGVYRPDLEALLPAIEEAIAKMEAAIEAEGEATVPAAALPEALVDARARRDAIQSALAELEAAQVKHLLPPEAEARKMKSGNNPTAFSYNAQAVVDDAHGIVVAEDVSNNAADYGQLLPMLDAAEANTGGAARRTVTDAGYVNDPQRKVAEEKGHTVIQPEHGRNAANGDPYHKSRFVYDAERDEYRCPQGHTLFFSHATRSRGNRPARRTYRCKSCKNCPVRDQCTRNKNGRTIQRDELETFRAAARARRDTPEAKALLKRRKAIVEPLFGQIKENHRFRRFTAKGLDHAKTQWAMLCLSVNLQKLYATWKTQNPPSNKTTDTQPPCFT